MCIRDRSYHVKQPEIIISTGEFGDVSELKEGDWLVDQHPLEDKAKINVLDHHGTYDLKRSYNLIYDDVPAGLIVWNNFKEEIPKSEWWKVVCAIVGDGQPELIPYEIFKQEPSLLNQLKTSAYQSYGKWKLSYYPIYKLLSSPINAFLRKGDFDDALRLITEAKKPVDIIYNREAIKAKAEVRSEFEKCVKNCDSYDFQNLNLILFYSDFRMSGYIASALQNSLEGKTIMAINKKNGRGSLRGDLAIFWRDRFKDVDGFEYLVCDGHAGFMGATLKVNHEIFVEDLTKLLQ